MFQKSIYKKKWINNISWNDEIVQVTNKITGDMILWN